MRRRRDLGSGLSLSFLDVICCGFGGIILVLVLSKFGEPGALERALRDLDALVAALELELEEIRGSSRVLDRTLVARREQLADERELLARLERELGRIRDELVASRQRTDVEEIVEGRLLAARQELTEEMRRLAAERPVRARPEALVGGIPVDSEYVIFVIDTSGSMVTYTWSLVVEKMQQALDLYPQVKGMQVLNDEGVYMFSRYAGKWIPDTPALRRVVIERLAAWRAFSNSSPVEGVTAAIRGLARSDAPISIYVLGDEFTGDSIEEVLEAITAINREDASGERRVRIHAIGFPTVFTTQGAPEYTGVRFATLMRLLCRENGGTFVGLNTVRR
jgi:hypothetical protein